MKNLGKQKRKRSDMYLDQRRRSMGIILRILSKMKTVTAAGLIGGAFFIGIFAGGPGCQSNVYADDITVQINELRQGTGEYSTLSATAVYDQQSGEYTQQGTIQNNGAILNFGTVRADSSINNNGTIHGITPGSDIKWGGGVI